MSPKELIKLAVSSRLVSRALQRAVERGASPQRLGDFMQTIGRWAPGAQARIDPIKKELTGNKALPSEWFSPGEWRSPGLAAGLSPDTKMTGRVLAADKMKVIAQAMHAPGIENTRFHETIGPDSHALLSPAMPTVRGSRSIPIALHELGHLATMPQALKLNETASKLTPRRSYVSEATGVHGEYLQRGRLTALHERLANKPMMQHYDELKGVLGSNMTDKPELKKWIGHQLESYDLNDLHRFAQNARSRLEGGYVQPFQVHTKGYAPVSRRPLIALKKRFPEHFPAMPGEGPGMTTANKPMATEWNADAPKVYTPKQLPTRPKWKPDLMTPKQRLALAVGLPVAAGLGYGAYRLLRGRGKMNEVDE